MVCSHADSFDVIHQGFEVYVFLMFLDIGLWDFHISLHMEVLSSTVDYIVIETLFPERHDDNKMTVSTMNKILLHCWLFFGVFPFKSSVDFYKLHLVIR